VKTIIKLIIIIVKNLNEHDVIKGHEHGFTLLKDLVELLLNNERTGEGNLYILPRHFTK